MRFFDQKSLLIVNLSGITKDNKSVFQLLRKAVKTEKCEK